MIAVWYKIEEAHYSKLVDFSTIEENEYTLNIRRYVDNTPPPEPEDVRAHLTGGVPLVEIEKIQTKLCPKFNFDDKDLFSDKEEKYKDFAIAEKAEIKNLIDNDKNVEATLLQLGLHLADWWQIAKDDFSSLAPKSDEDKTVNDTSVVEEPMGVYLTMGGDKFPKVRKKLLNTIKDKFIPVGVLDKFQVAGVFVNWWDNIKYDLKTIMQNGWDAGLIPDEYLIEEFFKAEQQEIEKIEIQQAEHESNLEETVEEALNLAEYEADEEEGEVKPTPKLAKEELKKQIDYWTKEKEQPEKAKPFKQADTEKTFRPDKQPTATLPEHRKTGFGSCLRKPVRQIFCFCTKHRKPTKQNHDRIK